MSPTHFPNPEFLRRPPSFIELLPLAINACGAAGRLLWFNRRAANLWGREPLVGDDAERFCGSHRVFMNGRVVARHDLPMAHVLRTGVAISGVEAEVERPDGTSVWAMVHIESIKGIGKGWYWGYQLLP